MRWFFEGVAVVKMMLAGTAAMAMVIGVCALPAGRSMGADGEHVTVATAPAAQAEEYAALTAARFLEAMKAAKDDEAFALLTEDEKKTRPPAAFIKECNALRGEVDISGVHTLAVMEEAEPAGPQRQAVMMTNLLPRQGSGRTDLAIGLTLVWKQDKWLVADIDAVAPGGRRDDYFEKFKKVHPSARYVDPISGTPELLAKRFVEAMASGFVEQAAALFIGAEEGARVFEGDLDLLFHEEKGLRGKVKAQLKNLDGDMTDASFKEFKLSAPPGKEPEPVTLPAGARFGPLKLKQPMAAHDNTHVQVKLRSGEERELKLDEMLLIGKSWRLVKPPAWKKPGGGAG